MSSGARSGAQEECLPRAVGELLRAYRCGDAIADLPAGCHPVSVSQARAVQDALVDALGGHGGWKVGQLKPGEDAGCAPIPRSRILGSGSRWMFPLGTPLEIEAEVAVSMGRDLTTPHEIGIEEVADAIEALHPAMEVVASRFADRTALPPMTSLADLQANAGMVVGPACAAWRTLDLATLSVRLLVDGSEAARVGEGPSTQRLLASLAWLANHARARGKPLMRGQMILTGARIGPVPVPRGALIAVEVAGMGEVQLST